MNTTDQGPAPPLEVSIVVCTFNRAKELPRAVASLMKLRTDRRFAYEIVIVDNASTDETAAAIGRLAAISPVPLRGVFEPTPGVAAARNRGISQSRGQWIAFFDDDQLADADWLLELWQAAERRDALCVGGAVRLKLPEGTTRKLAPICSGLLGETVVSKERPYDRKLAPGAGNLMVHRSVFTRVGGFNDKLQQGGEDTELFRRIRKEGISSWYTPKAIVEHLIPESRLTLAHLQWSSMRVGGHIADRERSEFGAILFPFVTLARMYQGLVRRTVDELLARLRGDSEGVLGARCGWWRTCGYIRQALRRMLPKLFGQSSFFAKLEFRNERGKPTISLGKETEHRDDLNSLFPPASSRKITACSKGRAVP